MLYYNFRTRHDIQLEILVVSHYSNNTAYFLVPLLQNVIIYLWCTLGGKTTIQGAQTTIYCAVSEEMEGVTGQFVVDCKIKKPNPQALDNEIAERLWEVSTELVGLK